MPGAHIVIIGGGFAGTTLVRHMERAVPADVRITLLSDENYITYSPLLAEVVGASILPGHVVAPIRQMVRHTRFWMVTVTDIDLEKKEIQYLGEGAGVMRYDHLVLACGVTADLNRVPGMAQHSLPLKTLGDALFLRNHVMVCLEQAEMQENPQLRRCLTTFIVVGGGFSGVEVAGEITDFLHASARYYPHVDEQDIRVILLHGGERLLPELAPGLGEFALRNMHRRGIDARLKTRVTEMYHRAVVLQSGEKIQAGTIICTVGTAPRTLITGASFPKVHGRIETAPDMSVPGYPGVWALGDCAAVVNACDGNLSPPTAQFATRQARQLADNIIRHLQGRQTRPFTYRSRGQLSSIGHNSAVAEIFGIHLSGFVAWLLWRGLYLSKIPTFARKVRVFFEWNWEMLFPPDIVHLRFTRTRRIAKARKNAEG